MSITRVSNTLLAGWPFPSSSGENNIFSTVADLALYNPIVAPDFLQTAGYSVVGDGGGAFYKQAVAEPTHAGKVSITLDDAVTVVWYQIASNPIVAAMVGGDLNVAAEVAFRSNLPMQVEVLEEATLYFNPTTEALANTDEARYDAFKLAVDWQRSCIQKPDGKVWIELADGYHYMNGPGFVFRQGGTFYLRSSGVFISKINAISSWAHQGGSVFNPIIEFTDAVPAAILGGDPIGFRNVVGNGDAAALTGGSFLGSINTGVAGVRTQVRSLMRVPRTTSLSTASSITYSAGLQSEILIPNGGLILTGGWSGSGQEGFFDLWWGAKMHCQAVGISYNGSATTDKEIIMVRYGAHFYCNQTLLVGADPGSGKVIRIFGENAGARLDNSIIGGGQHADRLVSVEGLASLTASRTSLGHAAGIGLILGPGCHTYFNQNHIASCAEGVRVTGMGYANIQSTKVSECVIGLYAVEGQIFVDSNTTLLDNNLATSVAADGTIIGTPTVS